MRDKITAVTTVYKTLELIKDAHGSFRKFYPDLHLIIVDNSGGDECTKFLEKLVMRDRHLTLLKNKENEGHGDGMHQGIACCSTDYIFVFDSDVVFTKEGLLEDMLKKIDWNVYGVGWILNLDTGGRNIPMDFDGEIVRYLYPAFMLLNRSQYYKYHKFTRFGLPPFKAMKEIHRKRLSYQILIDFPVKAYLKHVSGATRAKYGDCEDIVKGFKGRKGIMDDSYS
jgi:glycosyltransferase involved in cell wall biosynthesis